MSDVFVVEQHCAYAELDGLDIEAGTRHVFACDSKGQVVACARILAPQAEQSVRVGRVVVARAYRGCGLSQELMHKVLLSCNRQFPGLDIQLSAQVGVHQLYEAFGFKTVSEDYLDDGILHRDMILPVSPG